MTSPSRARASRVHGHVLDEDGRGVPNVLVELWQANAGGRYDDSYNLSRVTEVAHEFSARR
jgi:protocatechuate 3,4-dioxygenase beta subunit